MTTYGHLLAEALGLVRHQLALLCVLTLCGPQTTGELRTRTQRLYPFEDLADVEAALDGLMAREPEPLVVRLPRRPGQKEVRQAHLFAGEVPADAAPTAAEAPVAAGEPVRAGAPAEDRVATLEAAVAALREELTEIRKEFSAFRQ